MPDGPAACGEAIRQAPLRTPHRLAMGLSLLPDDSTWLQIDGDWAGDLRQKRRLLSERRAQVLALAPGSEPAQAEVLEVVLAALLAHHPGRVLREGSGLAIPELGERLEALPARAALELAASLVQEDLCVLERDPHAWRLTAACVCFPTRWDLPSKLGLPLTAIHDPVPGYRDLLAGPADRFFDALRPGRIAERANWSLVDSAELFQPLHGNHEHARNVSRENAAETVWLRVERQTLRRLPVTDAIVFTIRVHRDRLGAFADFPERARLLAEDLRSLPEELARYKSLPDLREPALALLDELAARAR